MKFLSKIRKPEWDLFFEEKIKQIFENKNIIVDIGGGLRILKSKGNRFDSERWNLVRSYFDKVDYKILDQVKDYNPDIIGDIHDLPLEDNSIDAILCLAVLEHIENPFKSFEEMYRVLKKDGYCFIYVPFLYPYHPMPGYYDDFWRYTEDSLKYLSKRFSSIELQNIMGRFETFINLTPIISRFRKKKLFIVFTVITRMLDIIFKKTNTKITSGYYVFLKK